MAPSVLFLGDPTEDYVADSLFHGLRTMLGAAAVDYPKRHALYAPSSGEKPDSLYGRGFGLYGLLEDVDVDRANALERAFAGEFNLVVVGSIWRDWSWWLKVNGRLPGATRTAVVDGADVPWMYPYGPTWWKKPTGWLLPRAHRRATYFKREWTGMTGWLRFYGLVPPPLSNRLPLERIAISYPAEKQVNSLPAKRQEFATHVVDRELAERLGRSGTGYAFENEADYLADLRASRFGITTKKAGWDTLRHYEIASSAAVPCFRSLRRKPDTCAPHGLRADLNCLAYEDADDLLTQIDRMRDDRWAELSAAALRWARENTTSRRAESFLDKLGVAST